IPYGLVTPLRNTNFVYSFRPFRNSDPPHVAQIWASQPLQRGLTQPVSTGVLEQSLFSKHFFDPDGFIIAERDGKPVGFAHAGFGPNDEGDALSTDEGVTYMLMVEGELWPTNLGDQLLRESENYLRGRGASVLFAGGFHPHIAFYLGLYGGSALPGVLLSDPHFRPLVARNHYRERGRVVVLQRDLIRFRPQMTRDQRRIGREVSFETILSPETETWWETSVYGGLERIQFLLHHRRQPKLLASVSFWDIEPLATSWGLRAAGMYNFFVDESIRRKGYGTYLMSEAFKELHKRGISLIEAQTLLTNAPALEFYKNLGFAPVDHGLVYRREAT
ncbi:MAG: GNAT family N-acetyltransferase, partial [Aeoliella sp.]